MIIIKNKYIPVRDFDAMTIYPFIFINENNCCDCKDDLKEIIINHEMIHARQQKYSIIFGFILMMLINLVFNISILAILIGTFGMFYILYLLNYLYNIFIKKSENPYYDIVFEKESYRNHLNLNYLNESSILNIFKYFKK